MHEFVTCRLANMPTYKSKMSRKIPNVSGAQRRCGSLWCFRTGSKCKMSRKIPNVSGVSTRFLRGRTHFGAQTPDSLMFLRDISILQRLKKRICEPCRSPTPDSFTFLRDILKNEPYAMETGMKKAQLQQLMRSYALMHLPGSTHTRAKSTQHTSPLQCRRAQQLP